MSAKINLLLVDDRPENLLALEAVLEPLGANLLQARSSEAALELAREHDFAAVLLDVQMPGMDGFETASRLRKEERNGEVPILFKRNLELEHLTAAWGRELHVVQLKREVNALCRRLGEPQRYESPHAASIPGEQPC